MTDITELAQREKFEAWWEREYKHLESSKYTDAVPHIKYGFWMAYQAGGAELVEALEKSEKTSEARREAIDRTHNMFVSERDRANAAEEALEKAQQHIARQEQILLNQDESLSIRRGELEAAQQERENWRTSFDNERFRADKLAAVLNDEIEQAANVRGQLLIAHKTLLNQQAKIAEMEEAEQKLCAANVTLDARAELAECRLAEMESRTVTAAAADVLAERQRQVTAEGWTPEHDDEHSGGEMALAASSYALYAHRKPIAPAIPFNWPWEPEWFKQQGARRDLVKAGALILAEIERIDRAAGIGKGE
ncbi:hypothetical protein [Klebsiella oxytoca]|uniref:hypothetical protein n=1 Tax=Klebsiella oxytoca TaxID=571 RepID=UPI0021B0B0C7|nr:hypothetical protein [Klebsiella oxytoca]